VYRIILKHLKTQDQPTITKGALGARLFHLSRKAPRTSATRVSVSNSLPGIIPMDGKRRILRKRPHRTVGTLATKRGGASVAIPSGQGTAVD
jgi:hypothetical protein